MEAPPWTPPPLLEGQVTSAIRGKDARLFVGGVEIPTLTEVSFDLEPFNPSARRRAPGVPLFGWPRGPRLSKHLRGKAAKRNRKERGP